MSKNNLCPRNCQAWINFGLKKYLWNANLNPLYIFMASESWEAGLWYIKLILSWQTTTTKIFFIFRITKNYPAANHNSLTLSNKRGEVESPGLVGLSQGGVWHFGLKDVLWSSGPRWEVPMASWHTTSHTSKGYSCPYIGRF